MTKPDRSPQLRSAWEKGRRAAVRGRPTSACPYRDRRTYRGGVTFSRAFRRAWFDGHAEGTRQVDT